MYTKKDTDRARNGLILHSLVFLVIAGACLTAVFAFSFARNLPLTLLSAVLGALLGYTQLTLKFAPWFRYWRFIGDLQSGRRRETDCWFVSISDQTRTMDGIAVHEVIVRLTDDTTDEESERMFFWDDDKAIPELKGEQKLHLESYGSYITDFTTV